jgi:hypothetical protein
MTTIQASLQEILEQSEAYTLEQDFCDEEYLRRFYGDTLYVNGREWCVPCSHRVYPPASPEDLIQAEDVLQSLGHSLPDELKQFLRLTDGADFFVETSPFYPGWKHTKYHIFSTAELVEENRALLADFRENWLDDPERHIHTLNYCAFCTGINGGYLCFLEEGPTSGTVFHLHREHRAQPYGPNQF